MQKIKLNQNKICILYYLTELPINGYWLNDINKHKNKTYPYFKNTYPVSMLMHSALYEMQWECL